MEYYECHYADLLLDQSLRQSTKKVKSLERKKNYLVQIDKLCSRCHNPPSGCRCYGKIVYHKQNSQSQDHVLH